MSQIIGAGITVLPPAVPTTFRTVAPGADAIPALNILTLTNGANFTFTGAGSAVTGAVVASPTFTTTNSTTFTTTAVAQNISINGNTITAGGTDANVDLNFITKGTGGWVYDGIAAGWATSQWNMRQSAVQTLDATITTLVTISLAEGEMVIINSTINGFQSDFTDALGATVSITAYRPTGGNVTQIGEEIINMNSTSTSDVYAGVDVGTQSVIIQIKGVAAETWNWVSTHQYMFTVSNI